MQEWHKRVKLFEGNVLKQIQTYTEAVTTVDPALAVGKPHSLWCAFAHLYERHGDIANSRAVFEKASQVQPASLLPPLTFCITFCIIYHW
jgi:pre-mRNA-splicing factor SYF1